MQYLHPKINNLFLHSVCSKSDTDPFIGIKIKNDRIDFFYPETMDISIEDSLADFRTKVLALLSSINLSRDFTGDPSSNPASGVMRDGFVLLSYLWIIRDYITNGFYKNREKVITSNLEGRINWKRTFQKQPIISNGNLIYNDIISEIPCSVDNILVDIHKICVKKSISIIGWLFGLTGTSISTPFYNEIVKKKYMAVIRNELNHTFDDYKKLRLTHMMRVLQGLNSDANTDEIIYGTNVYYYVFEKMIDSVFSSIKDMREFEPKSSWYLRKSNYKKMDCTSLRPDTILMDQDKATAYIIDSKYYRYGWTGASSDLPSTSSIQKQITYGEYLRKIRQNYNIKVVKNAFILPYNKRHNPFDYSRNFEYLGYATANWKNLDESHQFIHSFVIDLTHLLSVWSNHNKSAGYIDELKTEIEIHSQESSK